jgi:biotin/methionine sulfoxide reductase
MLGQIGLPGGGFGCGYSATNGIGQPARQVNWAALPQGQNPVSDFIPVARISDLLLRPGATIDYDGRRLTLPDIRLVYWVGGNPFHHHQDINRLLRAWQQPETIIVHERWWNTLARHADIVLPATTALERNDVAFNKRDGFAIAMQQAVPPVGQARNDHDIFAALAERFGVHKAFTEERSELDWLRYIYNPMNGNPSVIPLVSATSVASRYPIIKPPATCRRGWRKYPTRAVVCRAGRTPRYSSRVTSSAKAFTMTSTPSALLHVWPSWKWPPYAVEIVT